MNAMLETKIIRNAVIGQTRKHLRWYLYLLDLGLLPECAEREVYRMWVYNLNGL